MILTIINIITTILLCWSFIKIRLFVIEKEFFPNRIKDAYMRGYLDKHLGKTCEAGKYYDDKYNKKK